MKNCLWIKNKKLNINFLTLSLGLLFLCVPLDTYQIFSNISLLRILAIIPMVLALFKLKKRN